jgi:hypothetical protein
MRQPWPVHFAFYLETASFVLLAGLVTAGNHPSKHRIGPHGALDMEAQKAIAARLIPDRDVTQPPAPVDRPAA